MTERRPSMYDLMAPEERFYRLVELLAIGLTRLVQEVNIPPTDKPSLSQTVCESLRPAAKGRIPFGERQSPVGRTIDLLEEHWIKRIGYLSADGLSSEKIAKLLNQEDRESKRSGKWSRTAVWRILQKTKKKVVTK